MGAPPPPAAAAGRGEGLGSPFERLRGLSHPAHAAAAAVTYQPWMDTWTLESSIAGCPCCLADTQGISLCGAPSQLAGWILLAGLGSTGREGGPASPASPLLPPCSLPAPLFTSRPDGQGLPVERHRSAPVLRLQRHGLGRCAGRAVSCAGAALCWSDTHVLQRSRAKVSFVLPLAVQTSTAPTAPRSSSRRRKSAWCATDGLPAALPCMCLQRWAAPPSGLRGPLAAPAETRTHRSPRPALASSSMQPYPAIEIAFFVDTAANSLVTLASKAAQEDLPGNFTTGVRCACSARACGACWWGLLVRLCPRLLSSPQRWGGGMRQLMAPLIHTCCGCALLSFFAGLVRVHPGAEQEPGRVPRQPCVHLLLVRLSCA